ncbi:MAG: CBS domain-containing protein [Desulfobacterales bacterium]|uniref:CBS domain-containing protein n=1 Tax=Candidatus Desulfatibia vada TaxID=2841696 RepID=A0A8J6TT99_9BACT|nr:CBS domain-containing protein [Candidatus Desulfatibia vada]
MLVREWMSKQVVTVDADENMQHAIGLLKEKNVRMLPVMEKSKLVGIVTDRDLKRASASDATTLEIHELLYLISKIKVEDVMTSKPITVPWDFTLEEAADVLLKNKISGTPVTDSQGEIVGVITQSDIFKSLISLSGIGKRGIQIAVQLEDQPGSMKQITDAIRSAGGRMVSVLTSYEKVPDGFRNVYIRFFDLDRNKLETLKENVFKLSKVLYIIDHRENKREIYASLDNA